MRAWVCAAVVAFGLAGPVYAQQSGGEAVPVGVVKAERRPINQSIDFVGRVDAVNKVEIRARVKGFLDAVQFKEGDEIKTGAPLYAIEKGLFEADVESAQGALDKAKASLTLAGLQRQRAEDLLARSSGTQVARDQAIAEELSAKGSVLSAEASLATARINLGYAQISSPIDGKVGRTAITKGNVVGPDSGVLTTIVSQDPMYVTFPISQRALTEAAENGGRKSADELIVSIKFSDGSTYDQTGRMNFVDVTVNRTTDTVLARASIPNPRGQLIDGQFVRVSLQTVQPEEKVLIPQSALIADQKGTYVFIVDDGKAAVRRVTVSASVGADIVVDSGLSGGELIIVEGLQGVRAGIAVRATPVQPVGRS
ncbi:efflux RND transporter periplasmic adaptor subunit [Rhodoplanes roseus]|uniref:Efflux transporter periplasmic adaptor subunit n=1 Tax=Rhodoplanes roseus TaxID=29409 RepID=A0A327KQ15_9BRAD|nr:efflux RND transporter periplasmic adaptor subunit [Rhodoplanes roseus]RAI39432.1 efflux transporter periplasmic adaptor subunit [Rhodoplanes roseus]